MCDPSISKILLTCSVFILNRSSFTTLQFMFFFSKSIFTSLYSCLPVIYTDIFSLNTNSGFWCKCINDILVITMRTKLIFFLVISIFHGVKLQTHFITGKKKKSLRHVFTESLFTFLAGKHHFIRLS